MSEPLRNILEEHDDRLHALEADFRSERQRLDTQRDALSELRKMYFKSHNDHETRIRANEAARYKLAGWAGAGALFGGLIFQVLLRFLA